MSVVTNRTKNRCLVFPARTFLLLIISIMTDDFVLLLTTLTHTNTGGWHTVADIVPNKSAITKWTRPGVTGA